MPFDRNYTLMIRIWLSPYLHDGFKVHERKLIRTSGYVYFKLASVEIIQQTYRMFSALWPQAIQSIFSMTCQLFYLPILRHKYLESHSIMFRKCGHQIGFLLSADLRTFDEFDLICSALNWYTCAIITVNSQGILGRAMLSISIRLNPLSTCVWRSYFPLSSPFIPNHHSW